MYSRNFLSSDKKDEKKLVKKHRGKEKPLIMTLFTSLDSLIEPLQISHLRPVMIFPWFVIRKYQFSKNYVISLYLFISY